MINLEFDKKGCCHVAIEKGPVPDRCAELTVLIGSAIMAMEKETGLSHDIIWEGIKKCVAKELVNSCWIF